MGPLERQGFLAMLATLGQRDSWASGAPSVDRLVLLGLWVTPDPRAPLGLLGRWGPPDLQGLLVLRVLWVEWVPDPWGQAE